MKLTPNQKNKWFLLTYPDPKGLHPTELGWRKFARLLQQEIIKLEKKKK